MSAPPPAPKGHHYVPASYLGRFTDTNGFLHVYDSRRNHIRRQRPQKLMKIDKYYRQAWAPTGVDADIFETELGRWLETKAPLVFDKLIQTHDPLTEDEATTLLLYIELQRIRVPRQAASGVELMHSAVIQSLPGPIAELVAAGQFEIHMKDTARFDYMRMATGTLLPWMAMMDWEVISAETGAQFITSDSPVCFYNPSVPPPAEAGVALAGTIVLFPLSSSHILLMRHPECRTLDPLEVLPEPDWESVRVRLDRGVVWSRKLVEDTNWKIARLAHEAPASAW